MSGPERRAGLEQLRADLAEDRVHDCSTFFAGMVRAAELLHGGADETAESRGARLWVDAILSLRRTGRFADFFARKALSGSAIPFSTYLLSQGVSSANRWMGRPLLKTVYDYALYPLMIYELRPRTIFEIGSGSGASAMWFASLIEAYRMDSHVYSVDRLKPDVTSTRVSFIEGDSTRLAECLPAEELARAPHPWMVVEDAHVNIAGVIALFSQFTKGGDYLVIEDKDAEAELGGYLCQHPGYYAVDCRYTDYFGYNATCSRDQILRCMQ